MKHRCINGVEVKPVINDSSVTAIIASFSTHHVKTDCVQACITCSDCVFGHNNTAYAGTCIAQYAASTTSKLRWLISNRDEWVEEDCASSKEEMSDV